MTHEGAGKSAAKRLGITYEEYKAHRDNGEKWCCVCKRFLPETEFYTRAARCKACGKKQMSEFQPRASNPPGRKATTYTEVMDLHNQGLTRREIAEKLGCSYGTVARMFTMYRAGWKLMMEQSAYKNAHPLEKES